MSIGKELRELRLFHRKRLAEIAAASGLSISYLSDIERGHRCNFDTALETLNKILACYDLEAVMRLQERKEAE